MFLIILINNEEDNQNFGLKMETVNISNINTPIGKMIAGGNEKGLWLLEYSCEDRLTLQTRRLRKQMDVKFAEGEFRYFKQLMDELKEYFTGIRKTFSIPLVMSGTPFQKQVWEQLLTIPYGQTRSYKQQAIQMGAPEAIRAIAHANGENRMAILIPCHRVIGADGSLTGYGGGLWRKRFLLELEKAIQPEFSF